VSPDEEAIMNTPPSMKSAILPATKEDASLWSDIFDHWELLHTEFEQTTKDCAYWYLERANVGMLALAAHRAGYQVLEEYPWKKTNLESGITYAGRVDLWFGSADVSHTVEAKFIWFDACASETEINSTVDEVVCNTMGWRDEGENTARWIVVFVGFYVSDSKWGLHTSKEWAGMVSELVESVPFFVNSGVHFGPEAIAFVPCDPDSGDHYRRLGISVFVAKRK
jgi:hypothetical protein